MRAAPERVVEWIYKYTNNNNNNIHINEINKKLFFLPSRENSLGLFIKIKPARREDVCAHRTRLRYIFFNTCESTGIMCGMGVWCAAVKG